MRLRSQCFLVNLFAVFPDSLQIIKQAVLTVKDMNNHIAVIHQHPVGIAIALHLFGADTGSSEFFIHKIRYCVHLARIVSVCNDKEIFFVDIYDENNKKDLVIVDYNYIDEYWTSIPVPSAKLLLYLNGFIFNPYDKTGIEELEKTLIENERWDILRAINKAKIHLNVLHIYRQEH